MIGDIKNYLPTVMFRGTPCTSKPIHFITQLQILIIFCPSKTIPILKHTHFPISFVFKPANLITVLFRS